MAKSAKLLGIEVQLDTEAQTVLQHAADVAGELDGLLASQVAELKMLYKEAEEMQGDLDALQARVRELEAELEKVLLTPTK